MKKDWKKAYKIVRLDGGKTVAYSNPAYPDLEIHSRTRDIPHTNREGSWSHTEYAVVGSAGERIFYSLGDAIKWAEDTAATT